MAGGKYPCLDCRKQVAKGAKALACDRCGQWLHVGCGGLEIRDYDYMVERRKLGFRWFCRDCVQQPDILKLDIMESVTSALSSFQETMLERMKALEAKFQSPDIGAVESMPKFADIVREAVIKSGGGQGQKEGIVVKDTSGKSKVVQSREVLVVKPKAGAVVGQPQMAAVTRSVEGALQSVPVESCRETKSGALVVKFPSKDAKKNASDAIGACFGEESQYTVSEPKKVLPKLTLVGLPSSYPDGEIVEGLLKKNGKLEKLKNEGCILELLFSKTKGDWKHAVIKVSPEIRTIIQEDDWRVYVGLTRCRVYDRFWVTQCYHCQKFGHIAEKCPSKNQPATCGFCSGSHESRRCTQKTRPRCANCSSLADPPQSLDHFASSSACQLMASQRQRLIESTELLSSKNL